MTAPQSTNAEHPDPIGNAGSATAAVPDAVPGIVHPEAAITAGDSEPGDSEPGDSKPGDSEPGDSEPGDSEPGDSEPGDSEPDAAAGASSSAASGEAPRPDGGASDASDVTAPAPADAGVNVGAAADAASGTSNPDADAPEPARPLGLRWPIACTPELDCSRLGYPDVDGDGLAFDCSAPGYHSHQGTDIDVSWEQMDAGIDVFAAADGEVLWVFDGKYDRCPNDAEPDCAVAPASSAGSRDGVEVCTALGPYCPSGDGECFWCFAGGNVVVVRHSETPGVFATRYDHLKRGSIVVAPGDRVTAGQKLAEVGSAGSSTGPHLHFEVWGETFYDLVEPWSGPCGPNTGNSLWAFEPAWAAAALPP